MATITKLTVENVKRIKAVEITPEGSTVVIAGRNGQGKTSILDSIEMAFAGASSIPEVPVRRGEDSARIVVETEDLIVTRRFSTDGKSSLVVTNKDGLKYTSPQGVLDKLVGTLSFDPLSFMRMEPKKQLETLRQMTGLDTSDLDRERDEVFQNRTIVNRRIFSLKSQLDHAPRHADAPAEEVSVSKLLDELNAVQEYRKARAKVHDGLARASESLDDATLCIRKLEQELQQARNNHSRLKAEVDRLSKLADEYPEKDDTPLRQKISGAEAVNAKVRENAKRAEVAKALKDAEDESESLTDAITQIDTEKQARIAAAPFPLPGLAFGPAGVLFNGVPLEQASSAEQLRISVAIGLAMNPKLRVMLIRDGSLLDNESMAMLATMADEAGARFWIERVADGSQVGIVIEDGQIMDTTAAVAA